MASLRRGSADRVVVLFVVVVVDDDDDLGENNLALPQRECWEDAVNASPWLAEERKARATEANEIRADADCLILSLWW